MRVGIIGCGLIGRKRAMAIGADDMLVACSDKDFNQALKFADEFHCKAYSNNDDLTRQSESDIIIVAVINKFIREICEMALNAEKHVLAEKPLGRNTIEEPDHSFGNA